MHTNFKNNNNVIHIITRIVRGGADQNTVLSCIGLSKKKWNVFLVVGKEISYDLDILYRNGVKVIIINRLFRNVSLINDLKSLIHFFFLCKKINPIIVHTHTAKAGIIGRLGAKLAKVPIIIHTIHGSPLDSLTNNKIKRYIMYLIEKYTMFINTFYFSVGTDIKNKYCLQMNANIHNYSIVRSAFDTYSFHHAYKFRESQRRQLGIRDIDIIIGVIGRISEQKGYEYFAELCLKLSKTSSNFVFISLGRIDNAEYFNIIKKKIGSIKSKIIFLGEVIPEKVPKIISAMDIVVHTALWEGLPRSVVECLVSNKPVVSFDVEGIHEVINNSQNGYIVEKGNINEMIDKILFIKDKIGVSNFIKQSYETNLNLKTEFSINRMINSIEETYIRLIEKL